MKQQIISAVKKMKNNKVPGLTGLTMDMIKAYLKKL